ncbi:glycosyltransferase [Falsirhodobacter sp. 1013]|uniref:glycosyltransferase n=1 Tax=Falsirhodobacter sp. 1013 TaxID=3417566 RepID=UPI003EBECB54
MRILIGSAHPYLPQLLGGAQSSTHELALAFRQRGHDVCVVSGLAGHGWFGFRRRVELKLRRRRWVRDEQLGYPVCRAWFASDVVADVARDFRADVAMFQSGFPVQMARAMAGTDIPSVIYLHNVETDDLGGRLSELNGIAFIANSRFTAESFRRSDGISADVIYPMVEADRYRTSSSRKNVTFINPHPHKGVDIALKVAEACPDIPFVFVKAWTLSPKDEDSLEQHAARLSNLSIRPPTRDMQSVYGKARILLAPSRWEEAFGRVAAEAHLSGIPVVGSDRGGLPEAIGPGGSVHSLDAPMEEWVEAVRALWSDEAHYQAVSAAALQYSQRDDMRPERQIDRIVKILATAHEEGRK